MAGAPAKEVSKEADRLGRNGRFLYGLEYAGRIPEISRGHAQPVGTVVKIQPGGMTLPAIEDDGDLAPDVAGRMSFKPVQRGKGRVVHEIQLAANGVQGLVLTNIRDEAAHIQGVPFTGAARPQKSRAAQKMVVVQVAAQRAVDKDRMVHGRVVYLNRPNRMIQYKAAAPSFQPIFFPS